MKKNRFEMLSIIIIIFFASYFYIAVDNVQKSGNDKQFNMLVDAINKSAVQCYAIEGFYPSNIEYLKDNYGLIVDDDKYIVSYRIFASNIMPQIEVYLK